MNIVQDKILVMSQGSNAELIKSSIRHLSGIEIIEAASENKAFELIYNHTLVLVVIDETMHHMDSYKIGSMLMSHKKIHNAPLLILCEKIRDDNFLNDFDALQIDHLLLPFTPAQFIAKINIFIELHKQKNAVSQSLDELDNVYKKVVDQHYMSANEDVSIKHISNKSIFAANQIQQSLRGLSGNMYQLLRDPDMDKRTRSKLGSIKTAVERISLTTKKLISQVSYARVKPQAGSYEFLYIQDSKDDFGILDYFLKNIIHCSLTQAENMEKCLELIFKKRFDLIFIDFVQPEGSGFDLILRLRQMNLDIPIILTVDKSSEAMGLKAVSKGADAHIVKEELSSSHMWGILNNTLEKASLNREVEEAQNRIVMISRKDMLTRLFNRRCFEEELESEISKSRRYKTHLSIILIDFDNLKTIINDLGNQTGENILASSAAVIQSMVRNNDVVCRYGGQEFGIVLPNTELNGARMLAERIRKAIAGHHFDDNRECMSLTVSIGVAAFDREAGTTFSDFVKQGFNALTCALENGGNSVVISTDKKDL